MEKEYEVDGAFEKIKAALINTPKIFEIPFVNGEHLEEIVSKKANLRINLKTGEVKIHAFKIKLETQQKDELVRLASVIHHGSINSSNEFINILINNNLDRL